MYEIFLKLMKKKGVTPYRVHKDTGIAQSTLSDWKNGKSTPSTDKMSQLADYFEVSVDYLLGKTTVQSPMAVEIAKGMGVAPEMLMKLSGPQLRQMEDGGKQFLQDLSAASDEYFANHPYGDLKSEYYELAKELQNRRIAPDDVRMLLDTIERLKADERKEG